VSSEALGDLAYVVLHARQGRGQSGRCTDRLGQCLPPAAGEVLLCSCEGVDLGHEVVDVFYVLRSSSDPDSTPGKLPEAEFDAIRSAVRTALG